MKKTTFFTFLFTVFSVIITFGQTPMAIGNDTTQVLSQQNNSRSANCYATISFANKGCRQVHAYWNNNGRHVYYTSIHEGQQWRVRTYPNNRWVFKVNSQTIYNYTVRNCRNRVVSVDSKGCRTSNNTGNNTSNNCEDISYPLPGPPFPFQQIIPANHPNPSVWELYPEYTGRQRISHWTLDGDRHNDRSARPTFRVNYAQRFNACVVFTNGGQCCKMLFLPE